MKKIFFIFLILALSSFSKKKDEFFDIKNLKKEYAKIKEDLYVSKYEVSNLQYRNFLSDLMNSNQKTIYQICLPDSLCWRSPSNYNEPFTQYYFRHKSYDNYPVVGISYEAANHYCNWLTQKYNQEPKRKFRKVSFKLLTKEEWIFAASDSDPSKVYTWGTGFMQNNRKQYLCNFKHTSFVIDSSSKKYKEIDNLENKSFITVPVKSYYPNSFGLYNMCGNVAEMTSENGIAKGGSYLEPAYNVRIASEKNYTKPQADIGFRVAMEIIENKYNSNINFTVLKNYFVKNTVTNLVNPKIETAEKFNEIFGMATTMGENGKPTQVDISKQYIIAVVLPVTEFATSLQIIRLQKNAQNQIKLTYKSIVGKKQSFSIRPFIAIAVDKSESGIIKLEASK